MGGTMTGGMMGLVIWGSASRFVLQLPPVGSMRCSPVQVRIW
jgi:hypothetical protein